MFSFIEQWQQSNLPLHTFCKEHGLTAFLPVLHGLTALEVWCNITGGDPLCCTKCKTGRTVPQLLAAEIALKPG